MKINYVFGFQSQMMLGVLLLLLTTLGQAQSLNLVEAQQQLIGHLEFPVPGSYLFGIEGFGGWACNNGQQVTVAIDNGIPMVVPYGAGRADTESICGGIYNGFVGDINWAGLAPGKHSFCAYLGGVEIGCATVTVLTLGQAFIPQGSAEIKPLVDIPKPGTTLYMQWDTPRQRPVVVDVTVEEPSFIQTVHANNSSEAQQQVIGQLEFPSPGSYLFGVENFRGWACNNGQQVTVTIDNSMPYVAAYGGQRTETQDICGDIYNGFAGRMNWASYSPGEHNFCAYLGGAEIGCARVMVLNLGQAFIPQGSAEIQPLIDIPKLGTTLYMQWDTPRQRPVVVGVTLSGDVNGDNKVDALDVVAVINHFLGLQTWPQADVNNDGAVNALDVVAVINRVGV